MDLRAVGMGCQLYVGWTNYTRIPGSFNTHADAPTDSLPPLHYYPPPPISDVDIERTTNSDRKKERQKSSYRRPTMHHAKTDSEVTSSIAPSSPARPVYYVQSPSHDGEKTTTSFHSTPALSPTASPPHSHSSVGRHSRESSSSRFSGSLKPGSRKISPNDGSRGGGSGHRKGGGGGKQWKECDVIEEEGLLDDEERQRGLPRRCYFLAFVLGFFILFSFFSLILWGASKPQKPRITMKSITFEQLKIQAGSDSTGVATDMITVNSTVKLLYRNTGTFFGVHVASSPADLMYSQLTIASGSINEFYQGRKSQRLVSIAVVGDQIPLYGSGAGLSTPSDLPTTVPIPLRLNFVVRSRASVLGKLVNPKFYKKIDCTVTYDPKKINVAISLDKSCTYD